MKTDWNICDQCGGPHDRQEARRNGLPHPELCMACAAYDFLSGWGTPTDVEPPSVPRGPERLEVRPARQLELPQEASRP